jgi:hypothetical protein
VVDLRPMQASEWPLALELMHSNMLPFYERYGIPWDVAWLERSYLDKQNFMVVSSLGVVGFVSVESLASALHVHTLQLSKSVQHGRFGVYVLRRLLALATRLSLPAISCSVFKDHPARQMYARLGFTEVSEKGALVALRSQVANAKLRRLAA